MARAGTMLLAAGAVLLALGCGRRGELLGVVVDGAVGPSDSTGATTTAPRFSTPQLVVEVSDPLALDADPTFTGDLSDLFFASNRAGSLDIWWSHRASAADPWGAPVIVSELSSASADYGPAVSLDGLRMWFTTERDLSQGRIWKSSRVSRTSVWSAPVPISELASPARDFSPAVDATETTMVFGSNRLGAAAFDVYVSTRVNASAPWGFPKLVAGVNGPTDDWDPFVAQGGLVIFFTSTRQGAGDIFWSARQSIAEPFPTPVPLPDINSTAYDSDPSLSADLTYMLFGSMRSGNSEIYEAHAIP